VAGRAALRLTPGGRTTRLATPDQQPASLSHPLRLLIADANPIMRCGLRSILEEGLRARVVADAGSGAQALAEAKRVRPDAAVLEVRASSRDWLDALVQLARLTRVIALSHSTDPDLVTRTLDAGAVAFLVDGEYSTAQLLRAVAEANHSDVHLSFPTARAAARLTQEVPQQRLPAAQSATRDRLSCREAEVMDQIARGLANADVARCLGLSEKTVKNHVNRIFAKLHVTTRARAIVLWLGSIDHAIDDLPSHGRSAAAPFRTAHRA
jgi:DNA-binding NarL/FixJ family response regulator